MGIYMKFADIQGDATQQGFEGWINVTHFDWGLERKFAEDQVGRAFNREAAQAQIQPCKVTKEADSSSGKILEAATTHFKGEPCEIAFVRTGNPGETYLSFKLTDALIKQLDVSAQGGQNDRPTESITFDFTEVEIRTKTLNETNTGEDPMMITYDAATGVGG